MTALMGFMTPSVLCSAEHKHPIQETLVITSSEPNAQFFKLGLYVSSAPKPLLSGVWQVPPPPVAAIVETRRKAAVARSQSIQASAKRPACLHH